MLRTHKNNFNAIDLTKNENIIKKLGTSLSPQFFFDYAYIYFVPFIFLCDFL